jgi:myo-inositol 2-dehydrogenase / D-chiro-inositol 1-dehydrogenase
VGMAARFLPSLVAVKASLDAGRLGEPGLLRVHRWEPAGDRGLLPALTREIDLACWLFAGAPTEVYAAGRPPPDPDYVQMHLGFAGGGMALLDLARALPAGADYFSLSLIGSAGAAYADDHHNVQLLYAGGHPAALRTGQGDACLLAQLEAFLAAVEDGRDPPVTGAAGLLALRVGEAAAVSLESGRALWRVGEQYRTVEGPP